MHIDYQIQKKKKLESYQQFQSLHVCEKTNKLTPESIDRETEDEDILLLKTFWWIQCVN